MTGERIAVFLDGAPCVAEADGAALVLRLRELRGARSLDEAAEAVGIRPDELSKIERGKTTKIAWGTLLGLLTTYRCSAGELFEVRETVPARNSALGLAMAAVRANPASAVPPRRVNPDRADEVAEGGAGQVSEAALALVREDSTDRPVRRRFVPGQAR